MNRGKGADVLATALLLGSCGPAVADDAGVDAGVAAPLRRVVVEVVDPTPCEDWDRAEHPRPSVPADAPSSPELIWEWAPMDDPMLAGLTPDVGGFGLRGMTVGADGDLWVMGPTATDLTRVSRAGAAVSHVRLDDPLEHRVSVGTPAAAPDGSVFIAVAAGAPYVTRYGGPPARMPVPPAMGVMTPVIGPGGRVFIPDAEGRGLETCRLERTTRRVALEEEAGGTTRRGGPVFLRADGTMELRHGSIPDVRLLAALDGSTVTRAGVPASAWPATSTYSTFAVTGTVGGDAEVFSLGADERGSEVLVRDSLVAYQEPWFGSPGVRIVLAADGTAWRFDLETDTVSAVGSWPERPNPCRLGNDLLVYAADGTIVCAAASNGHLLALSPIDGSVRWEYPADPAEDAIFGLPVGPDLDGRIYAVLRRTTDPPGSAPNLVAIQTNLAPPGDGFCEAFSACTRHHNGWAHDYR